MLVWAENILSEAFYDLMSYSKYLLNQKPDVIDRTVMNVITPISSIFIYNRLRCSRLCVNVCKGRQEKGKHASSESALAMT